MPQTSDDDLREVIDIRNEVESRLYQRIERTGRLGKLLYSIIGGSVVCVISFTWWVASLNNQIAANTRYIEEERRDRVQQRLHDAEQQGQRRDNQIDDLYIMKGKIDRKETPLSKDVEQLRDKTERMQQAVWELQNQQKRSNP